jgi:hypothetical protein
MLAVGALSPSISVLARASFATTMLTRQCVVLHARPSGGGSVNDWIIKLLTYP